MRNLTRLAFLLALSISCGHLCPLQAQSLSNTSSQSGTTKNAGATVTGKITVQGKPKAGIMVSLRGRNFSPQGAPALKGVSDADGRYQITNVAAGNYQILPVSPLYVLEDTTWLTGPGKSLVLADGERVEDVDFSLVRGSVITGKVTHPDGRPVVEENVFLVSSEKAEPGARRSPASSFTQTDDRGIYRMYGVRAGRYKVGIGSGGEEVGFNRNRPAFQRTYSPATVDFDEARIVEVGEGTEATNIDITVGQTMKGFVASGVILDGGTNQPIPNIRLGIQRGVDGRYGQFEGATAMSNGRGEFRLENITVGKYAIFVLPQPNSDISVEALRFEIVDQDASGLVLKTAKGSAISGVVVLEGTASKEVQARMMKLRLYAYVRGEQGSSVGASRAGNIGTDGSFRIGGLMPGAAVLNIGSMDGSQMEFVISRIERDGVVQPRGGIEIKAGEQLSGVKIVLVRGTGTVRGVVKWGDGLPPAGARLVVRLGKPEEPSAFVAMQEVDARGRFVFQGVPAGSYEVILSSFIRVGSAPFSVRQSVNIADGASAEVELFVDANPKSPSTP